MGTRIYAQNVIYNSQSSAGALQHVSVINFELLCSVVPLHIFLIGVVLTTKNSCTNVLHGVR